MVDFLSYIFRDKLCDPKIIAEIVEEVLDDDLFKNEVPKSLEGAAVDSLITKAQIVCQKKVDYKVPYGPKIIESITLPKKIRIVMVCRWTVFFHRFLSKQKKLFLDINEENRILTEIMRYGLLKGSQIDFNNCLDRKIWVTGYDEVKGSENNLNMVLSQLGLSGFYNFGINKPWIVFSFETLSVNLHAPTILDAMLQPSFVSKQNGLSQAWNWESGTWGFPEYIISPACKIENPKVEVIYESDENIPFVNPLIGSYSVCNTPEIEDLVLRTLRQLNADKEIKRNHFDAEHIVSLTPREFELFMATIFERRGFETTVTKATRDNGFDIIAHRNIHNGEGVLIEAKHYSQQKVGIKILRELIGARYLADQYGDYKLCIATTNRFTNPVKKTVDSDAVKNVELLDGINLINEIKKFSNLSSKDIVYQNLLMR